MPNTLDIDSLPSTTSRACTTSPTGWVASIKVPVRRTKVATKIKDTPVNRCSECNTLKRKKTKCCPPPKKQEDNKGKKCLKNKYIERRDGANHINKNVRTPGHGSTNSSSVVIAAKKSHKREARRRRKLLKKSLFVEEYSKPINVGELQEALLKLAVNEEEKTALEEDKPTSSMKDDKMDGLYETFSDLNINPKDTVALLPSKFSTGKAIYDNNDNYQPQNINDSKPKSDNCNDSSSSVLTSQSKISSHSKDLNKQTDVVESIKISLQPPRIIRKSIMCHFTKKSKNYIKCYFGLDDINEAITRKKIKEKRKLMSLIYEQNIKRAKH